MVAQVIFGCCDSHLAPCFSFYQGTALLLPASLITMIESFLLQKAVAIKAKIDRSAPIPIWNCPKHVEKGRKNSISKVNLMNRIFLFSMPMAPLMKCAMGMATRITPASQGTGLKELSYLNSFFLLADFFFFTFLAGWLRGLLSRVGLPWKEHIWKNSPHSFIFPSIFVQSIGFVIFIFTPIPHVHKIQYKISKHQHWMCEN